MAAKDRWPHLPASALAPPGSRAAPRRARGTPPPRANAESAPRSRAGPASLSLLDDGGRLAVTPL